VDLRHERSPLLGGGIGEGDRAQDRDVLLNAPAALDRTLAALADPHRRRVVELLREAPRRAGELADGVGLSPAALSRHLRTLKASGLIEEAHPEFDARVRIYALKSGPMSELKQWLEETERLWAEQLAALKAHVEDGR
jgi:DNA-binding transcriptional ArsR family regulator